MKTPAISMSALLLYFLLFFYVHFALSSSKDAISTRNSQSKPPSFQMFAPHPTPRLVFVKDVMNEFEIFWPNLQNEPYAEHLSDLMEIWNTQIRTSSARVKNYYALDPQERKKQSDNLVLYYMVQVAVFFAMRNQSLMVPFTLNAIKKNSFFAYPLMDALEEKFPKVLTHVLLIFIAEGSKFAQEIITQFTDVIHFRVDPNNCGQRLSPLAFPFEVR